MRPLQPREAMKVTITDPLATPAAREIGHIEYQGVHTVEADGTTQIPRDAAGQPVPFGFELNPPGFLPDDQVKEIAGELSQRKSAGPLQSGLEWKLE